MTKVLSGAIRHELVKQHASLEAAVQELLRRASQPDQRELQKSWAAFETDLLRHLDLEEQSLFALVESAHPEEIRELRVEHDRIRDVVGELGIYCDLHAVRKHALDRLVRMLRSHAEREDATLYRWVDEQAPVETRRHLLRLLATTLRAELRTD